MTDQHLRAPARLPAVLLAIALAACHGPSAVTPSVGMHPASAASGEDLQNPPEVASAGGIARLKLSAVIDPSTNAPALEYDGALVPPTIRVSPGDTIEVTYENRLPPRNRAPFNVTNLHFHGLSTSPNPPADDAIDVYAMPGQTLHYRVPVSKTQPPGLYWYHSHAHHESNWQVFNGLSGAIVVEGIASFVKEAAGLPERILVLRNVLEHPRFRRTNATTSGGVCAKPFDIPGEHTTIDGRDAGVSIAMQAGHKQFWRVLNASANGIFNLSLDGTGLEIVSRDGVPIRAYPGGRTAHAHGAILPPGGRAEFIVDGVKSGAALRTTCVDTGPSGNPNPSQVLAVVSNAKPSLAVVPAPGSTPPARGTYEELVGHASNQRTLLFTEKPDKSAFYLNGQQYRANGAPMFTVRSGTVERWTLENDTTEVHAFHIHQVHFIVHDVNGHSQPTGWWDTFDLPPANRDGTPSVTHVTIDFRNPEIRGTFLFHCHLLQHEDLGMMAKILVK